MSPVRLATKLALCALLALATNACAQEPAMAPAPRAVWTWEGPSFAMLESPAVADEALTSMTFATDIPGPFGCATNHSWQRRAWLPSC